MDRRERIHRDRAAMAKRALMKAGYLEEVDLKNKDQLCGLLADFIVDVTHLAGFEGATARDFAKLVVDEAYKSIESDRMWGS